jgi:hypothetical protein
MAPLPGFLFDTYKRYKADTNRVTAWLTKTAQAFTPTVEVAAVGPSRPRGGHRLKGAARKEAQARKAAAVAATQTQNVSVNGLLESAQLIADHQPAIKVPDVILGLLQSAISLRKQCAYWFETKLTQEGALPTDLGTHSHFIEVLERIRQILAPNSAPKASDKGRTERGAQNMSSDTTGVGQDIRPEQFNQFDVLFPGEDELKETVVEPEPTVTAQSITRLADVSSTSTDAAYELNRTDEEVYFAIFCFFRDLDRLRDFLRDLWLDYKAGLSDLITVSVTTNTALELVQRAEQNFLATLPELESSENILRIFTGLMIILRGVNPEDREEPEDLFNFALRDVLEWTYQPTLSMIKSFLDVIQPNHVPVMKPGHFGFYDPHADRSKLTVRQRDVEDRVILLEALPEFFLAGSSTRLNLPVADKLIAGLHSVFFLYQSKHKKDIPLWVAYGAQIFLDIHHVLREDAVRAHSELKASGTQALRTLKQYFATSKIFVNWPQHNEQGVRMIGTFIEEWIEQDPYMAVKKKSFPGPGFPEPQPFSLLQRHPLLCGLFQFHLYLLLQDSGITLAGAWGSILYVCHLYHACRQGGYLKESWPDMEMVMDIHTRKSLFAGRPPETVLDSLKCMTLMLGLAPENFARNARFSVGKRSKKGPRGLSSNSPVTNLFREQIIEHNNRDLTLTLESVEELFRDQRIVASSPTQSDDWTLLYQQWAKSHKMTVQQLLATLADALNAEASVIRFDYFSLHLRCMRLLKTLRDTFDEKFQQYFGPEYMENETQLPFTVGYIFMAATSSGKAADHLRIRDAKSIMMQGASDVVQELIKREGSVEKEKLEKEWEFESEEKLLQFRQLRLERVESGTRAVEVMLESLRVKSARRS